jgi:transposase
MKEDLRQIWLQPNERMARLFLEDWLANARASGIRMLEQFANTLAEHHEGILNYYDYPISTGPLEGTNNKIQLMKRQAYGFRDHEFLKLKILGLHETQYALVG